MLSTCPRKFACVSTAPFGSPVVPEVYTIVAGSSCPARGAAVLELLVGDGGTAACEGGEVVHAPHAHGVVDGCQGVGEQRDVGVRASDAHADARVGDDRLDLGCRRRLVHRDHDAAGEPGGEVGHRPLVAGGRHDRDRVAGGEPHRDQALREGRAPRRGRRRW